MPQTLHEITFTWPAARRFSASAILPHTPYYVTSLTLAELRRHETTVGFPVIATERLDFPYADKLWIGGPSAPDLNGKHVAYFHDGKLGDELVHSTFLRQLRIDYPACDLHTFVTTNRYHAARSNWATGMEPRSVSDFRTPTEMEAYDYWIMPAPVSYLNRGSEENIYDLLERETGIAPELRQPYVYITGTERESAKDGVSSASLNGIVPPDFFDRLVLFQLNSTEAERSPDDWYARLRTLRTALPNWYFAVVGDHAAAADIVDQWRVHGGITDCHFFLYGGASLSLNPRGVLVLAEAARLIICPDSFLLHAAAAFDIPCLALWQCGIERTADGLAIPPPQSRIATYPNAVALDMRIPHEMLAAYAQNILC